MHGLFSLLAHIVHTNDVTQKHMVLLGVIVKLTKWHQLCLERQFQILRRVCFGSLAAVQLCCNIYIVFCI